MMERIKFALFLSLCGIFLLFALFALGGCAASPDIFVQKNVIIHVHDNKEKVTVSHKQESTISPSTEVDQDVSPDIKIPFSLP